MKLKAKILTIVLALAMLFSIIGVFAIPASAATYYVAGSASLCGASWSPADSNNKMTLVSGTVYKKEYDNIAAGTYEFKVTDGTWNNTWGWPSGQNYKFTVSNSNTKVTIYFDNSKNTIAVCEGDLTFNLNKSLTSVIYLKNSSGWGSRNVHAWNSSGANNGWPGPSMTLVSGAVYKVSLSSGYCNVIFSNNASSQTGDLLIPSNKCVIFDNKTNVWSTYHTPGSAATCTTAQSCTQCGVELNPALTHAFASGNDWSRDENYHWYACSRCDATSGLGAHDYTDGVCTCGQVEPECSHNFGEIDYKWSVDNATCTATKTCTEGCGESYTQTVNTTSVNTATCTEGGNITYTATFTEHDLGTDTKQVASQALGHDEVSHAAQASTCTEKGWDAYVTCKRCDYTTYNELSAKGHNFVDGKCDNGCNCIIIYFENNWKWADPSIYYWGSEGTNPDWPGVTLTDDAIVGQSGAGDDIYKLLIPADVTGIIFNGNGEQSEDVTGTNIIKCHCYYMQYDGNVDKKFAHSYDYHKYGDWAEVIVDVDGVEVSKHQKVCTECNTKVTEDHTYSGKWQTNGTYHWKDCDTCGYDGYYAEHEHNIPNSDDTHHWNECYCGHAGTKVDHDHNIPESDDTQHWNECSCGHADTKENHDYTIAKSNETQHWKECSCGHADTKENHDYTIIKSNETQHWKECSCGHADTKVNHDYTTAKYDDTQHWDECSCGHADTKVDHDHNIPESDDTQHWNECSCGHADTKVNHDHTIAKSNETQHWKECSCGHADTKVNHDYTIAKSNETQHWKKCSCGHEGTKVDHSYEGDVQKDETHHWQECECGDTNKVEHNYNQTVSTEVYKADGATCTKPASYYMSCECGAKGISTYTYGETLDHKYVKHDAQTATCEQAGNAIYYTCETCTNYFTDNSNPKAGGVSYENFILMKDYYFAQLGHDYSGDYVDNKDGTHSQLCVKGCEQPNPTTTGHVYDKEVAEDTYKVSDATCTAQAVYNKSCACGAEGSETFSAGEKAPNNHSGKQVNGGTADVHTKWNCCDVVVSSTHSYGDWTPVADTNTHKHTCSCGYFETEDHSFANYVYNDDATCTADGTETGSCVCGATHTQTDADSKLGHNFGAVVEKVDATCTEAGHKAYKQCTREGCKLYFNADVNENAGGGVAESAVESTFRIPAAGHNYGEWIPQIDAKCTTDGTLGHYTCDKCGKNFDTDKKELDSLIITAPGHSYEDATCTAPNTCTVCGTSSGAPTGHSFTNGATCANGCGTTAAAQIGDKYYLTFLEALNYTMENGATEIKVLKSVREVMPTDVELILDADLTITADSKVTLEFYNNGTSYDFVVGSNNNNTLTIAENVTFDLEDRVIWLGYYGNNVDVKVEGYLGAYQIWHGADTTVSETGTLDSHGEAFVMRRGALLNVEGGTVKANYFNILAGQIFADGATIECGSFWVSNTGNYTYEGNVSISIWNSTLNCTGNLKTDGDVSIDIYDSVVSIKLNDGVASNIGEGTNLDVNGENAVLNMMNVTNNGVVDVYDAGEVNVDGKISGNGSVSVSVNSIFNATSISEKMAIIIDAEGFSGEKTQIINADLSGFTGTIKVINNATAGYVVSDTGVSVLNAIAQGEDGTYYDNLQDAVNAGGNVTLLQSVTLTEALEIRTNVVINMGTNVLTSTATAALEVTASNVSLTVNGKIVLANSNPLARSGGAAVAQTVLTMDDVTNVTAILNAEFTLGAEDVIYSGEVDNITLKVLDDYVTHLAKYGYITGESDGTYVQVIGKSDYYIGSNGNWYIGGIDTGISAKGEDGENGSDGVTPKFRINSVTNYWEVSYDNGLTWTSLDIKATGSNGSNGEDGKGIVSIIKTSTEGLVDTYTITYTDGTTTTFTVTNGKNGIDGINGTNGKDGHTPVITIQNGNWHIDGVDTEIKAEGVKGETGNGISGINKTKTEGLVDTYTITYTDGTTTTFTVTNGKDGIDGINGTDGKDGHTPVITIVDGYWTIDGEKTTQLAQGLKGETGNGISGINKTKTEGLVDTYTITYTDGTTTTFTVTNGKNGIDGINGIDGKDGHTPVITIVDGYWTIDGEKTTQLAQGLKGETGNGISDISKTGTVGLVDTYTITYTDGTTTTFTVTNGADGHSPVITIVNGEWHIDGNPTGIKAEGKDGKGIKAINKTTDGLVDTYTIIYTDDTEFTFTVTNGRGIVSITLTSTSADGLVDTYTITYNDGSTSTFTVTNGEKGVQGIQGEKGDDGHTPVITIQNGKWHVDGNDTGLQAQGVKGETGNGISDISKTDINGLVDTYTITYTDGSKTTFTVTNGAQGVQGIQGIPGKDGKTPVITILNGNWHIDGVDTGVKAEGLKGDKGDKGEDGDTPYIGENGNWWVGETDTGFPATGDDGHTPDITIGENGNWFIDGVDTGVKAEGKDGNDNNKIIIICIGIAALCIMTTIVTVSTKRFRRPWWILC